MVLFVFFWRKTSVLSARKFNYLRYSLDETFFLVILTFNNRFLGSLNKSDIQSPFFMSRKMLLTGH